MKCDFDSLLLFDDTVDFLCSILMQNYLFHDFYILGMHNWLKSWRQPTWNFLIAQWEDQSPLKYAS